MASLAANSALQPELTLLGPVLLLSSPLFARLLPASTPAPEPCLWAPLCVVWCVSSVDIHSTVHQAVFLDVDFKALKLKVCNPPALCRCWLPWARLGGLSHTSLPGAHRHRGPSHQP